MYILRAHPVLAMDPVPAPDFEANSPHVRVLGRSDTG